MMKVYQPRTVGGHVVRPSAQTERVGQVEATRRSLPGITADANTQIPRGKSTRVLTTH